MKKIIGVLLIVLSPALADAACKTSDLQACLDSACAINVGMDPAARCYLCGTSAAKKPEEGTKYKLGGDTPGMQSLSLGKSSKNVFSEKELKSAPEDPGERYQWATDGCLKKIKDCDAEDVTDNYDKLIDQSCKVALGESEYAAARKNAAVKKTSEQCNAELSVCLLGETRCKSNMVLCEEDSDFNSNFSACITEVGGCDEFTTSLRGKMMATKNEMAKKRDNRLTDLVALKKMEREERFAAMNKLCTENGKEGCIIEMCGNMPIGLDEDGLCGSKLERQLASNLCKFVDTACNKLK